MNAHSRAPYILGLDLGPNSVGWARLPAEPAQDDEAQRDPYEVTGLGGAGARVFEAGVAGDLEQGREESLAVDRRKARLARRGLDRRGRRLEVLYGRLAQAGLLPALVAPGPNGKGPAAERRSARDASAQARHEALLRLDKTLRETWLNAGTPEERRLDGQRLPYLLRAAALERALAPHELGRALYHLGQRRGFLSNRKAPKKADEKPGVVEQGISALRQGMGETGSRTLGEYLARCDPYERHHQESIRTRYTQRDLYRDEFEAIWVAQAPHHPAVLGELLKKALHRAIFHQRPLRSQKHLVGTCELEPGSRRTPVACLEFQRYRLLQQVNNTRLVSPDGVERPLTPEERRVLVEALERTASLSFTQAKKLLGVKSTWKFNFERGEETRFKGNVTAARLSEVFGEERWRAFTDADKEAVISDLLSIQRLETLRRRGERAWGLQGEALQAFVETELPDDHASFSRKALSKLLPVLDQWDDAGGRWRDTLTAQTLAGYTQPQREPLARLPSLEQAVKAGLMPAVRNPAVTRTLTELRKVVNAIIAEHGLPAVIRVELGRDLRNSRDRRERMAKANRAREKQREAAAKKILDELGDGNPRRDDIEKVLLAEECNWECPYTGTHISMRALLGETPQFDVEHIVPYSRSLDDSFLNKTLCHRDENLRKRNKTPWEAYHMDTGRWAEMLARVKDFKGYEKRTNPKLERFQVQDPRELLEGFTSRQLNDTRYASRLAREYLGLLYGGTTDANGRVRVQVGQGMVTAELRKRWRLGSILRDGGAAQKRDDHRHHAVDAVAIGLTGPRTLKWFSDAAGDAARDAARQGRPLRFSLKAPWEGYLEQVREAIEGVRVSHRLSRRVRGRLHEDTLYSPPKPDADGKPWVHVRKPVNSLSAKDLAGIVDGAVAKAVRDKLAEIGSGDPAKLDLRNNPPTLRTKRGPVPIFKVRVRRPPSVLTVGGEGRARHVISDANHHAEILEVRDKKGRVKWEGHVVSLLEAYRRKRAGEPVVRKDHGPDKTFLFTLAPTEAIELDVEEGNRAYFHVRSLWIQSGNLRLRYAPLNDARKAEVMKKTGASQEKMLEPLRKLGLRKVVITPLGEVHPAND